MAVPFTVSGEVRPDDITLLTGDDADPTGPGMGHHLTFDRILRRCGQAWIRFLEAAPGSGFGMAVIAPHVEVDYAREVGVGPLAIEVVTATVGRTSFGLRLTVRQRDAVAATAQVTLVSFDYAARTPMPLTAAQREYLLAHLEPTG